MVLASDVARKMLPKVAVESRAPVFVYQCDTCQDNGFVRVNVPHDHPLFGRLLPCPDCQQRAPGLVDEYGLYPADRGLAWPSILDLDPSITAAVKAVRDALECGWGWVYLWGGYGTAKTTILKIAVAEHLRIHGLQAAYLRMSDLMDDIRAAYDTEKPQIEIQKRLRWYSSLSVLAIDEFEKVSETGFVEERRFQVLDARYEAAYRQHYGVTLMAANSAPESLPGALESRVKDGRFAVVHITAKDMRPLARSFENDAPFAKRTREPGAA